MKPLLIVANFKSNMISSEAKNWLELFAKSYRPTDGKKIVLCPTFTLLQAFRDFIEEHKLQVALGAQNISRLPEGAYTGEVNGAQIRDFADYVIVGHSERRQFGEDESVIEEKIKMATDYKLTPILCIQNNNETIPKEATIVAYEPVFAIGTGIPDTPENAQRVASKIKGKTKLEHFLYGGSVTSDNINTFTSEEDLSGVLVGGSSLDPLEFSKLVDNA